MQSALLVLRLLLAAVFVVAAVGKARDQAGTRRSLESFGVPRAFAPAAAVVLPAAELAIAVALVPVAIAWWAALAALFLLIVFTVAIAVGLRRGVEAECHCFGAVSSRPVGAATIARNLVLVAIAAVLVAAGGDTPGGSAVAWIGDLDTGELVLLGIVVVLAVAVAANSAFMYQLLRQNGRLWSELDALRAAAPPSEAADDRIGQLAPGFVLPDLDGEMVELDELLDGDRGVALFFSDPRCAACADLYPLIGRLQRDPVVDPRPVLFGLGAAEDHRATAAEHGIEQVLLHPDSRLPRELGIVGTPGLVVLDRDGRFAHEPMLGPVAVSAFLTGSDFSHSAHADLEVTR
ncbi:MAG TPA: MauE/DoxX family redox-associated membrane protein [Solirubrobacterales bacterium]|nr:MauE/DoxX family redox-associated membrane protein [Solirubrobacterales bacterium]